MGLLGTGACIVFVVFVNWELSIGAMVETDYKTLYLNDGLCSIFGIK